MFFVNVIVLVWEGCCFEIEVLGFLDLMDDYWIVNWDWVCVICVFIYIVDENLVFWLDIDFMLIEMVRKNIVDKFFKVFMYLFLEKEYWESYFELIEEIKKVWEFL